EQRGLDVHARGIVGIDAKPIGAGNTGAVEYGMHHDTVGARRRPLDPELAEHRKFFAGGLGHIYRETAGRKSVILAFRHGTEIAGALEHDKLVLDVGTVQRVMQAETRNLAYRRQQLGNFW